MPRQNTTRSCSIPDCDKPIKAHVCGNRICVNPRHIRWATRSENELDKRKHGRDNRGDRHYSRRKKVEQLEAVIDAE